MSALDRTFRYLLLAPALLPIVIWNGLIYPYLVPKTLVFYTLSILTVSAGTVLFAYGRSFYVSRLAHWEAWIPGALLALAYSASYVGIDFYRSFWSLFVRGDGLLMLTCAVASFYFILVSADRAFFERLLKVVAFVASFVAIYGIGEWLFGGDRVGSLLGNAAFFAGYLGIALFATLAAARMLAGKWRTAAHVGAALQVVAIVLTATRGTILALGLALVVVLIHLAWHTSGRMKSWSAGILGALVVLAGLFFVFRSDLMHVPFTPIARIASIGTNDPDVASRLFIWKHMLGQIADHPWLGVGAEHIDVLFNHFYDPTQIQEQWFDRSHSAFLDYAAQYGAGGLLLYLALIASFLTAARRYVRHASRDTRSVVDARMTAGFFSLLAVTYAAQNFFVFDTVSSFWLFMALLAAFLAQSYENASPEVIAVSSAARLGAPAAALAMIALIVPVSIQPALAAHDLSQAYRFQLTDVPQEVSYLSHGIALDTYGTLEYGYEVYDMYGNTQAVALSGEARIDAYRSALAILTANFNRYPYDARTALYLAHVLALAPPDVAIDQDLLSSALERAIRLSPKRAQPWYILANLSISEANVHPVGSVARAAGYAAAKDILSKYISLVPELAQPHFVLAQLSYASGDTASAAAEAEKGKALYRPDLETARRAAGYYESTKEWRDAAWFLREALRLSPADAALSYDLAKVLYLMGDRAGAEAIVAELRVSNPSILPTDPNFLAAITAYEHSLGK